MDIKQIVFDLCAMNDEQEWFEFKENWFQPETLGEYVSALSNAAAFHYKKYAYFIWGVEDENHKIVGTTFNQYCDHNKEPYQNYLARNLSPSLNFSFEEVEIQQKRVVVLVIPAAFEIPTAFKEKRYIRIGSSKCNIKDYPKREIELFKILDGRIETNARRRKILIEMRDNPNITAEELRKILGISKTAVDNNISFLRENGYIERVGSKKAGYWNVL